MTGPDHAAAPRRVPVVLFAVVVAMVGINVRASLGAVPPLLPDITGELALSNTQAGLITALAVAALGLSAPLGHRLGARIGAESATAWCLALLCVAQLARALPAGTGLLFATTVAAGAAMGAASSMVPALISAVARGSRGLLMGIYSAGMSIGVAAAAALAVPLERVLGGWRPSLAAWGVLAAFATLLWTLTMVGRRGPSGAPPPVRTGAALERRLPWSSRAARLVTAFFTLQMMIGYGCMAWLLPLYLDLGRSTDEAAGLFVLFQISPLVAMLVLPPLTDLVKDRRPVLLVAVGCNAVGLAMLLVAPLALAVPAVVLIGLGCGGGSTLALVLVADVTDSVGDGSRLTAMTMVAGNGLGALSPLVLGVVKDVTGSFVPGIALLLVAAAAMGLLVPHFRRGLRLVDGPVPTGGPSGP